MDCRKLKQTDLLGLRSEAERRAVAAHLRACAQCSQEFAETKLLRDGLRALRQKTPPPDLSMRLRVMASRHLSETRHGWGERAAEHLRLQFENLMRPLAVPFAGGLASTIFLFALLVPSLAVHIRLAAADDVPLGLSTEATLKSSAPISFATGEAVVDVTLDDEGRMLDYSIVNDRSREDNPSFCHSIANYLLFTTFTPPTTFGQPVGGTIRLTFRSNYVDVRG